MTDPAADEPCRSVEFGDELGEALVFDALGDLAGVAHGFTTAACDLGGEAPGGHERRRRLARALGDTRTIGNASAARAAWVRQAHGARVVTADEAGEGRVEADAIMTDQPGVAVMCVSADCPIILLADERARAVAVVHAGWRGLAADIPAAAVAAMAETYGCAAGELHAAVCPSARGCCYEVGPEVVEALSATHGPLRPDELIKKTGGKFMLDLAALVRRRLLACGLGAGRVELSRRCSICDERLHSYRRQGAAAGRAAGAIMLLQR